MKYEELDKYLTNEVKIPGEEGNHVVSFNEILISLASTSIKGIEIGRFLNTAEIYNTFINEKKLDNNLKIIIEKVTKDNRLDDGFKEYITSVRTQPEVTVAKAEAAASRAATAAALEEAKAAVAAAQSEAAAAVAEAQARIAAVQEEAEADQAEVKQKLHEVTKERGKVQHAGREKDGNINKLTAELVKSRGKVDAAEARAGEATAAVAEAQARATEATREKEKAIAAAAVSLHSSLDIQEEAEVAREAAETRAAELSAELSKVKGEYGASYGKDGVEKDSIYEPFDPKMAEGQPKIERIPDGVEKDSIYEPFDPRMAERPLKIKQQPIPAKDLLGKNPTNTVNKENEKPQDGGGNSPLNS